MHPVQALQRLGGAARWSGLRGHVARGTLLAAVDRGDVLRPARGLYALPSCPPGRLAAVAAGGVVSCASAALAHGLDVVRTPGRVHVTAPRGSRLVWRGTVVHRRTVRDDGGRTDVLTTVLDCLRCLPPGEGIAVADSALRLGLLSRDDLVGAAGALGAGDARRDLLAATDPASGSCLESLTRWALVRDGFAVRSQVHVPDVGRVDLLVDDWLVVETDGFGFHADRASFRTDRRRDAELTRRGFVVLRFGFEDVVHRPDSLLAVVRDTHVRGRPPFAWTDGTVR
ncbi:hypothetical protein NUM3379_30780 [Kineococcus sp. NUM-3379]